MRRLTKWDVCAVLERHLVKLLEIKKHLKKLKASITEVDDTIKEIQALIENLSIDSDDE